MDQNESLSASLEDYLEAILILERRNRVARVKEIAEALNVQMPSVSGAVKTLRSKGLVLYEKNSYIRLSEKGMEVATSIQNRHLALAGFLRKVLCLDANEAQDLACKIEHVITPEVGLRLQNLTSYINKEVIDSRMDRNSWNDYLNSVDNLSSEG